MLDNCIMSFLHKVERLNEKKVLDAGCGKGKWGFLLKSDYVSPKMVIGVDA